MGAGYNNERLILESGGDRAAGTIDTVNGLHNNKPTPGDYLVTRNSPT